MSRTEMIEALLEISPEAEGLQDLTDEELQNLFNMKALLVESEDDEDPEESLFSGLEDDDDDLWSDDDDEDYMSYLDETED